MTDLILWSYDASPFTQKALGMLGVKGLDWRWVETPMMPPKDDLVALTGGYRGTPVLQVGADVYVDSQLIARELERRFPSPTLFPAGGGLELALVRWSDAFFRSGLKLALALLLPQWPEPFRKDREYLFPDVDFDTVQDDFPHAKSQFRAHAALLEAQLADGRDFLAGPAPGLADIQAYPFVWMARGAFTELAGQLLGDLPALAAWESRMKTVGEGRRRPLAAAEALAEARGATSRAAVNVDPRDPQGLRAGQRVEVSPDDTRRGAVHGELVIATAGEIAVRRRGDAVGEVVIHFPRLGYRVDPVA
ncbi:MAG: glutathione S-transferase family protein [Steroidobacteraceae bacterium]|nr:glutathione S-transferase family protein [Steroidobacteraceae bacterium]